MTDKKRFRYYMTCNVIQAICGGMLAASPNFFPELWLHLLLMMGCTWILLAYLLFYTGAQ